MSATLWPPATFEIATPTGPAKRAGYEWKGLGLHLASAGSPKGRRKPRWHLTHLGSGHLIGTLTGDVATAFPVATEIADAGDWTFDGPLGWQNQFPDVRERVLEILARHPKVFSRSSSGGGTDHDQAREMAIRRAA